MSSPPSAAAVAQAQAAAKQFELTPAQSAAIAAQRQVVANAQANLQVQETALANDMTAMAQDAADAAGGDVAAAARLPTDTSHIANGQANVAKAEQVLNAAQAKLSSLIGAPSANVTEAPSAVSTKGTAPMSSVKVVVPSATAAALGWQNVGGIMMAPSTLDAVKTALAVKAPAPTVANPSAGKTFLGIPVVDAVIGGAALAGLAVVAKIEGWL